MPAAAFPPDVVDAVCRHMNDDHAGSSLLICRTLGGVPGAAQAQAVGVDGGAMRFRVVDGGGGCREVDVAFAEPVQERAQVRLAVVELYERARAAAGIPPRSH